MVQKKDRFIGQLPMTCFYSQIGLLAVRPKLVDGLTCDNHELGLTHYAYDRSYSERKLPAAVRKNLRYFRRLAKKNECTPFTRVGSTDLRAIVKWIEDTKTGRLPKFPPYVDDGKIVDPKKFQLHASVSNWQPDYGYLLDRFELNETPPKGWGFPQLSDSKIGRRFRRTISSGWLPRFCLVDGEDCEGFCSYTFYMGKPGELLGVATGCAACPYVYTRQADGSYLKEGEILRELRRPALETVQSLVLRTPVKPGQTFTVQLREEKRETTYLDTVWLDLCGTKILPNTCGPARKAHRLNYCDADNIYDVFKLGESRELSFDIPVSTTCDSALLFAEGYYVPDQ